MLSMTGFSSTEGVVAGVEVRLEMKSLNHRFLETKLRLPREFSQLESEIKPLLQTKMSRGAIEIKLEIQKAELEEKKPIQVNETLAKAYSQELTRLAKALNIESKPSIEFISSLPEVMTTDLSRWTGISSKALWSDLRPILTQGLDSLVEMRKNEGARLKETFENTIDELKTSIQTLRDQRELWQKRVEAKQEKKLTHLFETYPIQNQNTDELLKSRISQELAILLDKTDIEEELVRFSGHLDHLLETLNITGPRGRKIDFLLQELNREVNTLGNKAQDVGMSEDVVQIKVRLEQLREQAMNIE